MLVFVDTYNGHRLKISLQPQDLTVYDLKKKISEQVPFEDY